jgi:hypothetical protein
MISIHWGWLLALAVVQGLWTYVVVAAAYLLLSDKIRNLDARGQTSDDEEDEKAIVRGDWFHD